MQGVPVTLGDGRDSRPHPARVAFVVVLVIFVAQIGVRFAVSEPFPGIFQPSFGDTPQQGDVTVISEPVVTVALADGTSRVFDYEDVLPETLVLRSAVFETAFGDDEHADEEETQKWLAQRIEELAPGQTPDTMTVEWHDVAYSVTSGSREDLGITKTVDVDLAQ